MSKIFALHYACQLNALEDYSDSLLIGELLKGACSSTFSSDPRRHIIEAMLVALGSSNRL